MGSLAGFLSRVEGGIVRARKAAALQPDKKRNERRHPAIEELNDALVGGVIALGLVMPDRR